MNSLSEEQILLNHIDEWCEQLNNFEYNSNEYNNALKQIKFYKKQLHELVIKKAKKKAKRFKSKL